MISLVSDNGRQAHEVTATKTYGFLLVSLHNGEVSRVGSGLHDEPGDGLLVLAVDAAGLDQLGLELFYGRGLGVGAEVDGDCVDHGGLAMSCICGHIWVSIWRAVLVDGR